MTNRPSPSELERIWRIAGLDRKRAAVEYAVACDRLPKDRNIVEELEYAVRQSDRDRGYVSVPFELVLGILLRPRSRTGGHPTDEVWKRRFNKLAERRASVIWAELVEEYERRTGKKARQTAGLKRTAAETAHREVYGHDLSVGTIFKRMVLKKGQLDLRRNRG